MSDARRGLLAIWVPWGSVLGLTILLLVYPIELRGDPVPRFSPDLFPDLRLFGAVLYAWTAALLALLWWRTPALAARWHGGALVMLAGLVLRAFWNIKIPVQGQAYMHINAARAWEALGHIKRHPAGSYFDWPGVSLVYSAVSQTTGLSSDWAAGALGVFISVAMALAAYVLFLAILPTPRWAAIAAVLVVAGNPASIMYLTAGPMAIVLVVLFLVVLFHRDGLTPASRVATALLLLAGTSVLHFHSAMHFFFFLGAVWCWQWLRRVQPAAALQSTFVVTLVIFAIPLAWLMLWGFNAFVWVTRAGWTFLSYPLDLWAKLTGLYTVQQSNFGEVVPGWYRSTRLFWLGLLYVPGGLLWLLSLRRWRKLAFPEGELVAAFTGLAVLSLLSGLLSPRGFGELLRGLTYVPFLTVPVLLLFLHRLPRRGATAAVLALTAVVGALALPTFLANNHRASMLAPLRTEYAVGRWLASMYGTGRGVQVFLTHPILGAVQRSLLEASFTTDREAESTGYASESRWDALDRLLTAFAETSRAAPTAFFIHSPKIVVVSNLTYSIPVDDPRWARIAGRLSERYPEVYTNGVAEVYAAVAAVLPSARR